MHWICFLAENGQWSCFLFLGVAYLNYAVGCFTVGLLVYLPCLSFLALW